MIDRSRGAFARPNFLLAGVSITALALASGVALAQSAGGGLGTIEVETAATGPVGPASAGTGAPPISSDRAIGRAAPPGSAPALAPSQGSLNAFEPGSTVSDKVLRDIVQPSSDYNEAIKFTPGFYSNNANGPLGDAKGGWRGFADGQYNITFDGVPCGDANDPSHHSAAYFPGPFLGRVVVDRGPGAASQVGYAPFGGTLSLFSRDLTDKRGGSIEGSIGNYGTYTGAVTAQSGIFNGDTRAMFQYSYNKTDGALQFGHVDTNNFLLKVEKDMGDVKATLFGTYSRENYNNTNSITYAQWQTYGKSYGQVNGNPLTQQFVGYNNSQKQTDLEYLNLEGGFLGFKFNTKIYTYAYEYPSDQNNGNDQSIEGPSSIANGGTVTSVGITNPVASCGGVKTCKTTVTFAGVAAGDVTGFKKFNDYRAFGNISNLSRDIDAGFASGTARAGFWLERVDNSRYQQYFDYTKGVLYSSLGPTIKPGTGTIPGQDAIDLNASSYKLNLNSHITNFQPYFEYEWRPLANLSITPGFKYESFTRDHLGSVNQTTLQPVSYSKTYTASLPFLAARYKVTPEFTVYAQASKGFLAPTVSAYYVYNLDSNSIAPQETTNYQAGAVYKSNNLTVAGDVYQVTSTNFPVVTVAPDGTSFYTNAGTARYQGVELEGTYAIGKTFGRFGDGLAVYGSGAISNAKFIEGANTGLAVPSAPRYTAAGGLIYDDGMFFGSLLHKITGEQYGAKGQVLASATVNPLLNHISAYDTTDLVVGVRSNILRQIGFGEKAEFKFGVSNIFDHRSVTDIGGAPTTLTAFDPKNALTYAFQPGRIIYAGLKVDF